MSDVSEMTIQQLEDELEELYQKYDDMTDRWCKLQGDKVGERWEQYKKFIGPTVEKIGELSRQLRMKIKSYRLDDLPSYGDHMKIEDFIGCVEAGGFIDSDGDGCYATDMHVTDIVIHPSDVKHNMVRNDFKYIVWYNK